MESFKVLQDLKDGIVMNVRFVNVAIHENRVLVRGKEKASEVCLTFFWNSTSTSHYVDSYSLIIVCHLKLFSHC